MSRPPLALRGARPRPRAGAVVGAAAVLWRFSRPHTLIGTALSIAALYVIAVSELAGGNLAADPVDLLWTLVAGACVNVFIVGVNQVEDVEIDRINKPFLPIAAGDLSIGTARRIVGVAFVAPLALAVTQGAVELVAVAIALAVGAAYSCPPLRCKRFPVAAAISITFVRAVVVNLGVWLHFAQTFGGEPGLAGVPAAVWALTAITVPFSFAIAILKDLPDAEGDRRYDIATFTVRVGPRPVLLAGVAALTLAGLGLAAAAVTVVDDARAPVLTGASLLGVALLWRWAAGVDVAQRADIVRFYQRVWRLFFAAYVVVPLAVAL